MPLEQRRLLTERLALVTGATDGIGKATAKRLLDDGWEVAIVGRSHLGDLPGDQEALWELTRELLQPYLRPQR